MAATTLYALFAVAVICCKATCGSVDSCIGREEFEVRLNILENTLNEKIRILEDKNKQMELQLRIQDEALTMDRANLEDDTTTNNPTKDPIASSEKQKAELKAESLKERRFLSETAEASKIAFSVVLANAAEHLGQGQTILFDKVVSNLGNAFDIRIGVFTASVQGWYVFSLAVMSRPNEVQELQVVKDGVFVFHCYADGDEYNSASKTMVVHLETGNELWVKTHVGVGNYSSSVHGYEHVSFTGWLLYTD